MRAEGAVDAAAFYAEDYTKVDGDPFCFGLGTTVGTPSVPLVMVSHYLKEFRGVFFETITVCADVCWPRANSTMPVDAIGCACG